MEFFSVQDGGRVQSIAAGRHYSRALTSDGRLFAWGSRSEREHLLSGACGRDREETDGGAEGQQGAGAAMATLPRVVDAANQLVSCHGLTRFPQEGEVLSPSFGRFRVSAFSGMNRTT